MDLAHSDVSRHHCLLDIDPPRIRVRDLGSRNGTFVNGQKIGQRPTGKTPEEVDLYESTDREVGNGDEIQIGHTIVQVVIRGPSDMPPPSFFPLEAL
jgi:pSer/pThr/pTyr-binding forkhead associated (FHA) protein